MFLSGSDLQGSLHFMFMLTAVAHDAFGGALFQMSRNFSAYGQFMGKPLSPEKRSTTFPVVPGKLPGIVLIGLA